MTSQLPSSRRRLFVVSVFCLCGPLGLNACSRPYRVGDHVLVEWGDEKSLYPAFIVERKGKSRYRVHYQGYPGRWDEDVALPRIRGYAPDDATPPPPPRKVRIAQGLNTKKAGEAPVSPFKEGDRVRVRWRESTYRAVVLQVVSANELKIHYDGHEDAWDEVIPVSRVVASN